MGGLGSEDHPNPGNCLVRRFTRSRNRQDAKHGAEKNSAKASRPVKAKKKSVTRGPRKQKLRSSSVSKEEDLKPCSPIAQDVVSSLEARITNGASTQLHPLSNGFNSTKQEEFHIKVSAATFEKWLQLKEQLAFSHDEYLLLHLIHLQATVAPREPDKPASEVVITGIAKEASTQAVVLSKPSQANCVTVLCNSSQATGKCRSKSGKRSVVKTTSASEDSKKVTAPAQNVKRRKISRYDCRKTPENGIPPASKVLDEEEVLVQIEDDVLVDPVEDTESPLSTYSNNNANWCRHCDVAHSGEAIKSCPLYSPVCIIPDAIIDYSSSTSCRSNSMESHSETRQKPFSLLSLPSILELCGDTLSYDPSSPSVQGVRIKINVSAFTQFGPLQGEPILERDIQDDYHMRDLWTIDSCGSQRIFLTTANAEKSNWLRYVRPAPNREARNLAAVTKNNQLYMVTTKDLTKGEEILYWIDDPCFIWTKKRADKKNCGGCNLTFSHPLYYRLHCSVFHDPQFSLTIRKYHCKICGLSVLGKENIIKHAATKHSGKGAYQCQFCKKFFLRLNYLEMHRTYGCSSNPDRTRPLCGLCGKKFCQPQKLKVHMKRMHGDLSEIMSEFQCPICGKMLGTKHAMIRHIKEVHSDESKAEKENDQSSSGTVKHKAPAEAANTRVNCFKCGKFFKNKSNLKIHMLTHSGVRPFGCKMDGCSSKFTTKQCLQFHYRKAHQLSDAQMPKIVREIPYTLSAYSGGLVDDSLKRKKTGQDSDRYSPPSDTNEEANEATEDEGDDDLDDDDAERRDHDGDSSRSHNEEDFRFKEPSDENSFDDQPSAKEELRLMDHRPSFMVETTLTSSDPVTKSSGTSSCSDEADPGGKAEDEEEPAVSAPPPVDAEVEDDDEDPMTQGGFPESTFNIGEACRNVTSIPVPEPLPVSSVSSSYESYFRRTPPPPFSGQTIFHDSTRAAAAAAGYGTSFSFSTNPSNPLYPSSSLDIATRYPSAFSHPAAAEFGHLSAEAFYGAAASIDLTSHVHPVTATAPTFHQDPFAFSSRMSKEHDEMRYNPYAGHNYYSHNAATRFTMSSYNARLSETPQSPYHYGYF